jgi:riboflavin kinase
MLKPHLLITLYKLAEFEAELGRTSINTSKIAEKLYTSQQTVSRNLIELEKLGLIKREKDGKGEVIVISSKGLKELNLLFIGLKRIFEPGFEKLVFLGKVFTGLGEGAYYVSLKGYVDQFIHKLGFKPYPGTLNIKLREKNIKNRYLLDALKPVVINRFEGERRSFGPVNCFKTTVNGLGKCAVIEAHRTHYGDDVIEVISAYNLRRRLGLKDGDEVEVTVFSNLQ